MKRKINLPSPESFDDRRYFDADLWNYRPLQFEDIESAIWAQLCDCGPSSDGCTGTDPLMCGSCASQTHYAMAVMTRRDPEVFKRLLRASQKGDSTTWRRGQSWSWVFSLLNSTSEMLDVYYDTKYSLPESLATEFAISVDEEGWVEWITDIAGTHSESGFFPFARLYREEIRADGIWAVRNHTHIPYNHVHHEIALEAASSA